MCSTGMKRRNPYVKQSRSAKRQRRQGLPIRSYRPSQVPLASRGYRPNAQEKKVFDVWEFNSQCDRAGQITLLFNPTLGSDMNNRVGRKALIKSIYIRGFLCQEGMQELETAQRYPAQQARVILVWDCQPNGAAPALSDILATQYPGPPVVNIKPNIAQLNINNRDRFRILSDKTFTFDPMTFEAAIVEEGAQVFGAGKITQQYRKFKKVNLETIFGDTSGGTIADIKSGALYLVTCGSVPDSLDENVVEMEFTSRIRYSDP